MKKYPRNHVTHSIDLYKELTTEEYFDTISDQSDIDKEFELEIESLRQNWSIYHDNDFFDGEL